MNPQCHLVFKEAYTSVSAHSRDLVSREDLLADLYADSDRVEQVFAAVEQHLKNMLDLIAPITKAHIVYCILYMLIEGMILTKVISMRLPIDTS